MVSSDTKSVEKDVISLGPLGLPAMAPTEMVPPTKKGSLFANRRRRGQEEEVEGLVDDDDEEEDKPYEHPRDRLDTQDIHFTNVMTKIVEKELKEDQWKMPAYKRSSFPVAQRRVVLSSKTGGKARSIFSMDFDSKRAMAVPSTSNSKPSIEKDIISLDDTPTSQLMPPMDTSSGLLRDDVKREGEGEGECSNYTIGSSSLLESAGVSKEERDAIHEQNVSLLAGMTMDDIAEAKEEILDKIDPDVIKLLRARANKKAVEAKEQHIKLKQENDLNTKKDVVESNSNPHGADDADIGNDQSVVNTVKEKEREIEREEARESRKKTITINREDGSVSVAITMVDVNGSHDLPVRLPIKPNKKWVNMNQLEVEKFDWMQDRSTPAHGPLAEISKQKLKEEKEKAKQSRIEFVRNFVRFDFTGLIIPFDMDVDSAQALHHHGDDEEYAGYTIKELVHLMRSALPNQRALSLSITSNILHQLLDGMFDEGHTFQTEETEIYVTARDIIGALKNAGYVVGLRLLLDDSKDTVLLAAIGAFSAWLAADYRATPDEDDDDVLQKPPTPTNQSGTESDDSDDEQDEETNSMTEIKELKVMSSKGDYTQVTRFRAYEMPARTLPPMSVAEENEEQITDEDVAKYDAVKGYLAMNVLQRLRYILEVCRIPMTVDYVFDILLRIASYSEDAANAIYECPRLMKCIYTNFGSPQWPPRGSFPNSEFPYGAPHPKAYQLLRVLCASSRTLAAKISLDGTVEASLPLICMDPSSLAINETKRVQQQEVAQRLSWQLGTEALQLWRVLLEYGLCDKLVVSIFPVLVDHLKVATKIRLTINAPMDEKSCVSLAWAASILNLIQSALHLATIQAKENAKNRNKNKNEKGEEEVVIGPGEGIDPSHLVGLFVPVTVLCAEWLPILEEGATNQQQDHNESTLSAEAFDLCAAALHTISSFFTLFSFVESDQLDQEVINTAVVILKDHVLPALKGNVCTWGLSVAVQWVDPVSVGWVGQWAERDGNARSRAMLQGSSPELDAIVKAANEKRASGLAARRQANGKLSLCNYLLGLANAARCGLSSGLLPVNLLRYLVTAVFPSKTQPGGVWFHSMIGRVVRHTQLREARSGGRGDLVARILRFQGELHYSGLLLAMALLPHLSLHQQEGIDEDTARGRIHRHAMWLLTCLQAGSDHEADALLRKVCLSPAYLSALYRESQRGKRCADIGRMLVSPELLEQLADVYACQVTSDQSLVTSTARALYKGKEIKSFYLPSPALFGSSDSMLPLPIDWIFIPFINIYNAMVDYKQGGGGPKELHSGVIEIVRQTLQLVFLNEMGAKSYMTAMGIGTKIARLMCVFLMGGEIFRDDIVRQLLDNLLINYTKANGGVVDFKAVPGVPFYDLYMEFLTHYAGVSWGDSVFQRYVMLPLVQSNPPSLRRLLWGECIDAVGCLSLKTRDLPAPLASYLFPIETDKLLLGLYLRPLLDGTVWKGRAPLPYWIAVHHLTGHFFGASSQETLSLDDPKIALMAELIRSPNQAVAFDVFSYFYTGPDSFPPEPRTVIPPRRMEVIGRLRAQLMELNKNES